MNVVPLGFAEGRFLLHSGIFPLLKRQLDCHALPYFFSKCGKKAYEPAAKVRHSTQGCLSDERLGEPFGQAYRG